MWHAADVHMYVADFRWSSTGCTEVGKEPEKMSALKDEVDAPQSPPTPLAQGGALQRRNYKQQGARSIHHHHRVWHWRAHSFGSNVRRKQPRAQIPSPGCCSRSYFLTPSEAWEQEFGANFLSLKKSTFGTGSRGPKDRPAFTLMEFGTGKHTVWLGATVSYSFQRLESENVELVSCRCTKQR